MLMKTKSHGVESANLFTAGYIEWLALLQSLQNIKD